MRLGWIGAVAMMGAFGSARAEAPPLSDPPQLTNVIWLAQPDGVAFARHYPQAAQEQRVEGRVILDCVVGDEGRLTCVVQSEDPPGYGFGEATLAIAQEFRAGPVTRDGEPTAGRHVRRAVRWLMAN